MSQVAPGGRGGIKLVSIPDSFESSMCCEAKPTPPREYSILTFDNGERVEKRKVSKLLIILNPFGGNGRGRRAWKKIEPIFARENVECVVMKTEYGGHATEIANRQDFDGFDGVVAIGGDGTINEVINGLMTRDEPFNLPLGFIPGGTGNSFMTSLKLLDPREAAEVIVRGVHTPIDIGKIRCRATPTSADEIEYYMFNLMGWGLGVDANATAESIRWCGKIRYDVGALYNVIKGTKREVRVIVDDEVLEGDYSVIMVLNNQHTGTALRAAPQAVVNDGRLDVVIGNRRPRCEVIKMFDELKRGGSHVYREECDYRQFHKLTIDSEAPTQINVDGENMGGTPATIETMGGALSLFVDRRI